MHVYTTTDQLATLASMYELIDSITHARRSDEQHRCTLTHSPAVFGAITLESYEFLTGFLHIFTLIQLSFVRLHQHTLILNVDYRYLKFRHITPLILKKKKYADRQAMTIAVG